MVLKKFKVNNLSVVIYPDKYQLAQAAADMAEEYINKAIQAKGQAVLVFSTGASQFEFLDSLTKRDINWKNVCAFHLDEFVGLSDSHPASFRKYLRERITDKVSIGSFYFVQGDCESIEVECNRLGALLEKHPVDVAFIGIGENGHIAFNDPPATFDDKEKFKIVELDESCKKQQVREGWFSSVTEVPDRAITMTIPAMMASKAILSVVPDLRKAEAIKRTLTWEISPEIPAAIMRQHGNAALFLDQYSASLLDINLVR